MHLFRVLEKRFSHPGGACSSSPPPRVAIGLRSSRGESGLNEGCGGLNESAGGLNEEAARRGGAAAAGARWALWLESAGHSSPRRLGSETSLRGTRVGGAAARGAAELADDADESRRGASLAAAATLLAAGVGAGTGPEAGMACPTWHDRKRRCQEVGWGIGVGTRGATRRGGSPAPRHRVVCGR